MAEPTESTPELSPQQRLKSTSRNDACPCGSGKKYKKCHLAADETQEQARLAELQKQAELARAAEEAAAAQEEDQGADAVAKKKVAAKGGSGKSKRNAQPVSKGQGTSARPNNLPRRKAV